VKQLALRDDLVRKPCEDRDASFAESLRALRQDRDRVKEQLAEDRRQATNLVKMMARMEGEPPEAMLLQCREFEREKKELEETLSRMGEEISKLEQTSMRVDLAGRTIRYLSGILDHPGVTPDHLKDCLPKFINHVTWEKDVGAHQGRFEVALFERPFRSDRGRLLRELVEDLGGGPKGGNGNGHEPRKMTRSVAPTAPGAQPGRVWGPLSDPASNKRPLAWEPEMDEVPDRPPFMLMIDSYFTVYQGRRRTLVTGEAPAGLPAGRPPQERTWRACRNRMNEEPPWEGAECYRRLMEEKGYRSIRALARVVGEDHSRLARVLKVLDLPEAVLVALREHGEDVRIRAHFTEKRLRQMAAKQLSERTILREIRRVARGAAPLAGVNA
jgi:predicted transcriptional regulator